MEQKLAELPIVEFNEADSAESIDKQDTAYASLQLWRDLNHNGASEPAELDRLTDFQVDAISLAFKESRHRDRWGNSFRYRARVNERGLGRLAYDVVFVTSPRL